MHRLGALIIYFLLRYESKQDWGKHHANTGIHIKLNALLRAIPAEISKFTRHKHFSIANRTVARLDVKSVPITSTNNIERPFCVTENLVNKLVNYLS